MSPTHERVRTAYEEMGARLWRAVFAYARRRDVADEAVAEAFAQALRRGDAIRDVERWVWRAAFRIAAGELSRPAPVPESDRESESFDQPLSDLLDQLGGLSDQQRQCVLLHYVGRYEAREIAEILGSTGGSVRVQLHRARASLAISMGVTP